MSSYASTPDAEWKDVMEQSKSDDAEGIGENQIDSLSEGDSCKSQIGEQEAADMDDNAVDNGVKESESINEKLLKDKESFAYKLRRLRAQLFKENVNGSMSSSLIDTYEILFEKFVTKFKHYKMSKSVRLLSYEVNFLEKKMDTKEALASVVNENKNGSAVTKMSDSSAKEAQ